MLVQPMRVTKRQKDSLYFCIQAVMWLKCLCVFEKQACLFMVALWNRQTIILSYCDLLWPPYVIGGGHYILPCSFFLLLSSFVYLFFLA